MIRHCTGLPRVTAVAVAILLPLAAAGAATSCGPAQVPWPYGGWYLEAMDFLAAKLYELGPITSGQAAELAGKSRVEFLLSLPRIGITVSNLRLADLENELEFAVHG